MSLRLTLTSIAFVCSVSIVIACGGSSGSGDLLIRGTLSTLPSFEMKSAKNDATAAQGIEICCGGSCDTTDAAGAFVLSTDLAPALLCTANGGAFEDDSFVIDALGEPGTYFVNVTAFRNADGTAAYDIEINNTPPAVQPVCGNGVQETTGFEDCDGSDLGGASCESQGFSAGDLSCNSDCTFNTGECFNTEQRVCGDDIIEEPEQCEGSNLDGESCESLGFLSGTLSCTPDCMFDTNNCTDIVDPPQCGNGVAEIGAEECDGADLAGATCESLGFAGGTLSCKGDCTYNVSECTGAPTPTCQEEEKICANTGKPPTCLFCTCNDGFPIGDCNATCADTGIAPAICTGGVGCTDGSDPICPG